MHLLGFVMSVCQSGCVKLAPTGQICVKFNIGDLLTSFEKTQIWLKLDKITEHFTGRPKYVYIVDSDIKYPCN
jgi:hypothetical protein